MTISTDLLRAADYLEAREDETAHMTVDEAFRISGGLRALASSQWQDIATAPTSEVAPFLVYIPAGRVSDDALTLQVSRFEGNLYPDHLGANVDWGDRVTRATHWKPLDAPLSASPEDRPK